MGGFTGFLDKLGREYLRQERERLTGRTAAQEEAQSLQPELLRAQIAEFKARPGMAEARLEQARAAQEARQQYQQLQGQIQQQGLDLRRELGTQPKPMSPLEEEYIRSQIERNRREPTAGGTGVLKQAFDKESGEMVFASPQEIASSGGRLTPPPTAERRNLEYQAQAVQPAFDLVERSLDTLEQATSGIGGKIAGMVPGTSASYAKDRFIDQAKALLGAIVARQAGEGSRLSDEDRRAYSQAATLVNNLLLLPGGVQEARARLGDARNLLLDIDRRRGGRGAAAPAAAGEAAPTGQTRRRFNPATGRLE
jgi:hypothetical protein